MDQDETGIYDTYNQLLKPWWERWYCKEMLAIFCCMILLVSLFFYFYKAKKNKQISSLDALLLYKTKGFSVDDFYMIYDAIVSCIIGFFSLSNEQVSLAASELVFCIKNSDNKTLLHDDIFRLSEIVSRADAVKFGKATVEVALVTQDIEYVVAFVSKKNISQK